MKYVFILYNYWFIAIQNIEKKLHFVPLINSNPMNEYRNILIFIQYVCAYLKPPKTDK